MHSLPRRKGRGWVGKGCGEGEEEEGGSIRRSTEDRGRV